MAFDANYNSIIGADSEGFKDALLSALGTLTGIDADSLSLDIIQSKCYLMFED